MRFDPLKTQAYRAMLIAIKPQGVTSRNFPERKSCDVVRCFRILMAAGFLTRTGTVRPYVHHATPEQYAAFLASLDKPNLRPGKPKRRRKAAPKASMQPVLAVIAPKKPVRPGWGRDDPPHLPYDDAGQPLFRVTVCPGFTGQPMRTNTHTGAY